MKEKRYILKKCDYYLSDIEKENNKIINFQIDKDYRKLYNDYEKAEEDRNLIFIETGLNLNIEVFKKEKIDNED